MINTKDFDICISGDEKPIVSVTYEMKGFQ